jgi:GT2 family glycosyltransferase
MAVAGEGASRSDALAPCWSAMASSDAVILCTRNRPDEVATALRSIAGQGALPALVVVVDSSDDQQTADVVAAARQSWPERSRLEWVASTPSLTHQRIVGLQHTESDLVHFVDDDVELHPEYFAAVSAIFEGESEVVGVGGYVTNQPASHVKVVDEWLGLDSRREGVVLPSGRNIPVRREPVDAVDVEWLSGCAMSYRRSALEREPPDETFPFEGEDAQLSFRIGGRGRLVVTPRARLVHHESTRNRVAGAAQVEAELTSRYRRVDSEPDRLSRGAFWVSAYGQLAKYAVSGVVTMSGRRLEVARGTRAAIRAIRAIRRGGASAGG